MGSFDDRGEVRDCDRGLATAADEGADGGQLNS